MRGQVDPRRDLRLDEHDDIELAGKGRVPELELIRTSFDAMIRLSSDECAVRQLIDFEFGPVFSARAASGILA